MRTFLPHRLTLPEVRVHPSLPGLRKVSFLYRQAPRVKPKLMQGMCSLVSSAKGRQQFLSLENSAVQGKCGQPMHRRQSQSPSRLATLACKFISDQIYTKAASFRSADCWLLNGKGLVDRLSIYMENWQG